MIMYFLAYLAGVLIGLLVFIDYEDFHNKNEMLASLILALFWPLTLTGRLLRIILR